MKARVKLVDGMTFVAEAGSGHAVVMDASPDVGGRDLGPRPMEMVLMGAGGCSAIDVVHILRKARQALANCVVELEAERAPEDPKVFTRIHMHYVVAQSGAGRARGQAVEGKVLLGHDHAREDRRHHRRFRDPRGLSRRRQSA
jgi:putative redox protein